MGRALMKSLLLGFFLIIILRAETPHTTNSGKEDPPKDNMNLPENERRNIILQNLLFVDKKFQELPDSDRGKPIARTESVRVEAAVENKAAAEAVNKQGKEVPFETNEVTNFSATDAQKAIRSVM